MMIRMLTNVPVDVVGERVTTKRTRKTVGPPHAPAAVRRVMMNRKIVTKRRAGAGDVHPVMKAPLPTGNQRLGPLANASFPRGEKRSITLST